MSEEQYKKVKEFGRQVNRRMEESIEQIEELINSPTNANRPEHVRCLEERKTGILIGRNHLISWLEFYGIELTKD